MAILSGPNSSGFSLIYFSSLKSYNRLFLSIIFSALESSIICECNIVATDLIMLSQLGLDIVVVTNNDDVVHDFLSNIGFYPIPSDESTFLFSIIFISNN